MKTLYLPIVVVASALSLASANAMPGLGRETGKFIRSDEPTPKDVRTFEPAKTGKPQANPNFLAPWKSQTDLSFLAPWKSQTNLSFLAPWKSQTDLSFLAPWHHPSSSIA
jgi:predicted small secreted protein